MTEFESDVIERLSRIETHLEDLPDHETRLRSIENKQWLRDGGLGVMAALLGYLGYHVTLH